MDKKGGFNYQVIKSDMMSLVAGIASNLEWDTKYPQVNSCNAILSSMMKITTNTYSTILFICADVSTSTERKPEYAVSIPALTRTIYETLVSLIYILEDVPAHIELFLKTAYLERRKELKHYNAYMAGRPEWQKMITEIQNRIAFEEIDLKLSPDEIAKPMKTIKQWPTPGGALDRIKAKNPTSSVIPFLEFMNPWLYSELSGLTHLNNPGFMQRSMQFLHPDVKKVVVDANGTEFIEWHLDTFRSIYLSITMGLMIAFASEVENHFQFGFKQRIAILWGILTDGNDRIKEIYNRRYASLGF
jgi:hypothetical protein